MIAQKDPYIKSAYDRLQVISQDKQMRLEYESREKAIRDHYQFLFEAEQRGRELGKLEGRELGKLEGKELGKLEGRELEAISIARNLISLGMDDATIMSATRLSQDKVKSLRKEQH